MEDKSEILKTLLLFSSYGYFYRVYRYKFRTTLKVFDDYKHYEKDEIGNIKFYYNYNYTLQTANQIQLTEKKIYINSKSTITKKRTK